MSFCILFRKLRLKLTIKSTVALSMHGIMNVLSYSLLQLGFDSMLLSSCHVLHAAILTLFWLGLIHEREF